MKYLVITIVLFITSNDPTKIGKINSAKAAAKKAYNAGDFKTAVSKYRYLIDSLDVTEDEVTLNLANAYFQLKDTANAYSTYQSLTGSVKNTVRSKAQQQVGVMHHERGKLEEALNNFKQAIKADPQNMDARYNYELLKKKLDEQKKQEQQKQNQKDQNKDQKDQNKDKQDQQNNDQQQKDQEKKDQEKKEQEQKEQQQKDQQKKEQDQKDQQKKEEEKKEQQEKEQQDQQDKKEEQEKKPQQELSDKLKQMKISEENARKILEAMKNQEVQYLQQNKRKATKPKDKGKPDW